MCDGAHYDKMVDQSILFQVQVPCSFPSGCFGRIAFPTFHYFRNCEKFYEYCDICGVLMIDICKD